ncbi:hypothetical protein GP486_000152 [Trichoglossum hirsutum]|uniref:Actin-like ATPase domain-containing protein n=1 Tax=Trichoglossum hirsutum TaxID=265104 RepID=A0A9P8LIB1_9PEZI|nr:hypothetical protein GP486_000152 [Trichoglossum hirsutum]
MNFSFEQCKCLRIKDAVDFGTTFSGVAYYFTGSGKPDPISITEWPGTPGLNPPKTPTLIGYDQDKRSFIWGSKVNATSGSKLEGIKLLLDPNQPTPLFVPAQITKVELLKLGKPPIDVATDYIGALYKHALSQIEKAYPRDYVQMHQKKFVLTVPAVWSDKAKDVTLRAARNAGIHPITLIKEPEAAALYTLHFLKNGALAIGDAFVLCDAGGGTVDLISYEVTALDPLELKELVPGTGGLAGSLMLNRRFGEFVKNIVGEEDFFALRKTTGFAHAMKTFDQDVKPSFRADPDQSWFINFPMTGLKDDPINNIQSNCLDLKCDAVRQIFEPLITAIDSLVAEQVNRVRIKRMDENHPKGKDAIFLVGGFGSSQYLKTRLEKANPDIQVIQPPDAWGAIVKGAVLSQMPQEAVITSVVAPRHYGVTANNIYRESEDAGQPKIWDKYECIHRVSKMTWFIIRGDDILRDKRIEFPFYRRLAVDYKPEDLIFVDELLESDVREPFKYPSDGVTILNCKLTADLRKVPRTEFREKVSVDGTPYISINYKLFVVTGASLIFGMTVNGKDIGSVNVDFG